MIRTIQVTEPKDWRPGDQVVVTHGDGSTTQGLLRGNIAESGLCVGPLVVRSYRGVPALDVAVTRVIATPDEPTGLGAVIEVEGIKWVRVGRNDAHHWYSHLHGFMGWRTITATSNEIIIWSYGFRPSEEEKT
jgi:hypothetical protein